MARLHVNTSRTTPFRIIKGHDFFGELLPFGECVQVKLPNMKDLAKGVPRWVRGVFVGKTEGSDEFIVLTPAGAQTFRTVRRLPEGHRHSLDCLDVAAGLPWNTKDGSAKVQQAVVLSKPSVELVPVYPPSVQQVPADTRVADKQGEHDDDPSSLHAPKRVRTQQEFPVDVKMSDQQQPEQVTQHFDITATGSPGRGG